MNKFKKIVRLLVFVFFMLLACIGVGLSGGVPVPFSQNRRDKENPIIEMVDETEEESEEDGFKV